MTTSQESLDKKKHAEFVAKKSDENGTGTKDTTSNNLTPQMPLK